ncbi:transposase [Isoptericola jiangsuensis]|uniref:transposase n=1 Tax=Isoptericola jiangsuensis TaxID=548579 RepID=UPI003B968178
MQRFKSSSALQINRRLGRSGSFWQSSYHDHAIRSDESLFRHAMYVLGNPIRAGLTTQLGEYPHACCRWNMDGTLQAVDHPESV